MLKKSVALGSACVIFQTLFWLFFKDAIAYGNLEASPIWIALAFLALFMVCLSLLLLLTEHVKLVVISFLLGLAPVFYLFGYSVLMVACVVLVTLGILRAYLRVRREAESRINYYVRVLLGEGLPTILTVLSLLLAAAYYTETAQAPRRVTSQELLPRSVFERILPYVPAVRGEAPDVEEVLYDIITKRSEEFIAPYEQFVPLGLAIAFFLFLRSIAFPFSWAVIWICVGIVKLLIIKGAVARVEEQTTKERLQWT